MPDDVTGTRATQPRTTLASSWACQAPKSETLFAASAYTRSSPVKTSWPIRVSFKPGWPHWPECRS